MQINENEINATNKDNIKISKVKKIPAKNSELRIFVCIINVIFKALCVIVYFVLPFLITSESQANLYIAVIIIILGSIDFWVVKNISGRLLVGLIWKKEFMDGKEIWTFKCKVNEEENNGLNVFVFWGSLVLFGIFWGLLCILNIFTLSIEKIVSNGICAALLYINLVLFLKCSRFQRNKLKAKATEKLATVGGRLANIIL